MAEEAAAGLVYLFEVDALPEELGPVDDFDPSLCPSHTLQSWVPRFGTEFHQLMPAAGAKLPACGLWIQNTGLLGPRIYSSTHFCPSPAILDSYSPRSCGSNGALSSRRSRAGTGKSQQDVQAGGKVQHSGSRRLPASTWHCSWCISRVSRSGGRRGKELRQLQGRAKERQRSQQTNLETI